MRIRIVGPEMLIYEGDAAFVAVPASDGEIGVLPSHSNEIATIRAGYVRVSDETMGRIDHTFAVLSGYVEIADDAIIVLADRAVDLATVDKDDVSAHLRDFEDQLDGLESDDAHRAYLYNKISWCKLLLAS
ncbi:ATP synthase F1 subcomplex epsilon subunit [Coriobacterium glomerans PW2]|uniref:ATP synthase epsilon chain n=1 Tax=Coriobacterium glomerans (strain ATCC 49209 / DSM 20642 / JCM 10262 / PW2) TaxID=700015 RepID=F2NAD2_CORGP|nr:ATP synthase F1 subunit epsilon [Coriobacterium glomerans]AEB06318.1 ATP synthase F1 subcomplex epsilon subunit [Coriobacterium glomerans PW2]